MNESARVIREMFGGEYYDSPRRYQTRVKNAQEAHEAIRPTDFRLAPSQLEGVLDSDELRLYELIWKRTMASQMVDARVLRTSLEISAQGSQRRDRGADRERQGDRVRRLPARVRRGQRRSRGGARGTGSDSAAVRGRRSHPVRRQDPATAIALLDTEAKRHETIAAGAVHGSVTHQGTGAARYRTSVDVRADDRHRSSGAATCCGRARRSCRASPRSR